MIPPYGKHDDVKQVGRLDYKIGRIYVEGHKWYDAEVFLRFLKNVLSLYLDGKIVKLFDNAGIYHAKFLKEFLDKKRKRLKFVFLPSYSPDLNKIEGLWDWLKDSVINNVFFHTYEEIQAAVRKFIDWISTVPQMVADQLYL